MKLFIAFFLSFLLSFPAFARETQEEKFQVCLARYKDVPIAYMEHVFNKPKSVKIPPEADLLIKQVRAIVIGETAMVDVTDKQILEFLVITCMKEFRA